MAERCAERPEWHATLSLAGRTSAPKPAPIETRVGGFGGVDGLARWLEAARTTAVVDATHPFAARISGNAAAACAALGLPLLGVRRPPWQPVAGDRWIEVPAMGDAVRALGTRPACVFLTVGRLELHHFAAAPQHRYLVRTIEPLGDALPVPHVTALRDRGPFEAARERELMQREGVEVVVTKNSGGPATYGKIAAARALGLPVILVARPPKPEGETVATAEEAMAWLDRHGRAP